MPEIPRFLFCTCQVGAESAVKSELASRFPSLRPSYARPGFLTFKLADDHDWPDDFALDAVLVRSHAFSLGKTVAPTPEQRAAEFWDLVGPLVPERLHVWQRDLARPGHRGFEPSVTAEAREVREVLFAHCPAEVQKAIEKPQTRPARRGELIADCVLVQPGEWWVGFHRAKSVASRWPGGLMPLELPVEAVSRAWLKMEEALRWSRLPIPEGARCAEIGSAPGGASQALLARGLHVLGIDPAEMDPRVLAHPNFTHLRRRSTQVKRREFRKIRWLIADMNVAPNYTLEAVEAIVTHPQTRIRGILLTLKLTDWAMIEQLPAHLERIRRWGYRVVRARQLASNRQEICVAALRARPSRRAPGLPRHEPKQRGVG